MPKERKPNKETSHRIEILLSILRIVVVLGCVLTALAFVIMLLFPAHGGSAGWTGLFK